MLQATISFSFQAGELAEKLKSEFDKASTGYWQIQIRNPGNTAGLSVWVLAVAQGKIIFSGNQKLSAAALLETLQRYLIRLRSARHQEALQALQLITMPLGKLLMEMQKRELTTHEEATQALRQQVLDDFDTFLYSAVGQAEFVPDYDLVANAPIRGFDLYAILLDSAKRQVQWKQMRPVLPGPKGLLGLNQAALEGSDMNSLQKQQLQRLLPEPKTLAQIAYSMGLDQLGAAKAAYQLIQKGFASVQVPPGAEVVAAVPQVWIVDDSPVLLKQFRTLVESWGYQVNACSDALTAVETMAQHQPAVIFLDINMPGASGFELIKQIRRKSNLSGLPLVLLTAEKTASNQWRAQWANCKFLAKPRSTEEIGSFRTDLRALLQELAPINPSAPV
jgi:CheY-like chemotaxis protein